MKKLIILLLVIFGVALAQDRKTTGSLVKTGTATTSWAKVAVGGLNQGKDLAIVNNDSDEDTLVVALGKRDTASSYFYVLNGTIENGVSNFWGDTVFVKSTDSAPYMIRILLR